MRNISFAITTQQVIDETKTVTRRNGWWFLKPGDILQGVEKCQGLKKGEKMKPLKKIRIISTTKERLSSITESECILESFPGMRPDEFISMFCKSHKGVTPDSFINRIEFEYVK